MQLRTRFAHHALHIVAGGQCLGAELACRHLHKQEAPKEVILKSAVIDKTNYQPFETPMDKRTCPTLDSIAGK